MIITIYRGYILNPKQDGGFDAIRNGALCVDARGKIEFYGPYEEALKLYSNYTTINFANSIITPGFIDLHSHLPQYPAIGCGKGELLDWLDNYIFPLEEKYSDNEFAKHHSHKFFENALKSGTTAIVTYCTSHESATEIAFESAARTGIYAFIGNSLMDVGTGSSLIKSTIENLESVMKLSEKWHGFDSGRLNYIVTPRYAGSASFELMQRAGEIAELKNLMIQTHLSENKAELEYIGSLYPEHKSYTDVYKSAGLVTDRTLFAHCLHLDEHETGLLQQNSSAIVHCPSSNRYLASGIFKATNMLDMGLKIGLGSDVAAGYSLSMLNEAKEAIETSKTFRISCDSSSSRILKPDEAFYMITLGAAKILRIDEITGSFEKGKYADFTVIDGKEYLDDYSYYNEPEDILSKLIYQSAYKQVQRTYIRGKCVHKLN